MAASLWKITSRVLRRPLTTQVVRCGSSVPSNKEPVNVHKDKYFDPSIEKPDPIGLTVGTEQWELIQRAAGNEDPFDDLPKKRAKGTFDEPTIVKSTFEKRQIGCLCDEDSMDVVWMDIYKEEPKRCACGYWFKLVDGPFYG